MTRISIALAAALLSTASFAQQPPCFDENDVCVIDEASALWTIDHSKTHSIGRKPRAETIYAPPSVLSNGQFKSPVDAANDRQNYGGR